MNLSEFHHSLGARFTNVNGVEAVATYGDALAEHSALRNTAGVLDLSFRGRLCLTGSDRIRYLHGQVTNDIKRLPVGEGCYAALVNSKGRLESDLNVFCLAEETLLDFEPGLTERVTGRLEKYIVADDVQVVDVAPLYGLLSIQGPKAESVVRALNLVEDLPAKPFQFTRGEAHGLGEIYVANQPRIGSVGFDLFVPTEGLESVLRKSLAAAQICEARACGWEAFELARIEAGIPRYGQDMDEANLPQESGIEARAVSYSKGCYIGQEVLNRLHTMGQANKRLCGLRFSENPKALPEKGTKLLSQEREVGWTTSAVFSPTFNTAIGLGYVRREACEPGTELILRSAEGDSRLRVVKPPAWE